MVFSGAASIFFQGFSTEDGLGSKNSVDQQPIKTMISDHRNSTSPIKVHPTLFMMSIEAMAMEGGFPPLVLD